VRGADGESQPRRKLKAWLHVHGSWISPRAEENQGGGKYVASLFQRREGLVREIKKPCATKQRSLLAFGQ